MLYEEQELAIGGMTTVPDQTFSPVILPEDYLNPSCRTSSLDGSGQVSTLEWFISDFGPQSTNNQTFMIYASLQTLVSWTRKTKNKYL